MNGGGQGHDDSVNSGAAQSQGQVSDNACWLMVREGQEPFLLTGSGRHPTYIASLQRYRRVDETGLSSARAPPAVLGGFYDRLRCHDQSTD